MVERCKGVHFEGNAAMINRERITVFVLILAGLLRVGVGTTSTALAQAIGRKNEFTGRIIRIEPREPKGRLRIKQAPGLSPIDGAENMLVRRGHLLLVEPNVRVTIRCGDGTDRDLMPGPQGCPCVASCTPEVCGISYGGSTMKSTRHDTIDGAVPTLISPRAGLLLDPRPTIRWTPPKDAKPDVEYIVSVLTKNGRTVWSRTVVSKTEMAYPADAPPLMPGHRYSTVVFTDPTAFEAQETTDLTLAVMPPSQAKKLSKMVRRLAGSRLRRDEREFLIANLYAAKGLYTDAIALIEKQNRERSPFVLRALGELYLAIGLNSEAEEQYLKALSQEPEGDMEEQALILSGLAWAYYRLGSFDQAVNRFEQARNACERLGDATMVERITKQIRMLAKSRPNEN